MPLEFESMDDVLKSEDIQKLIEEQVQKESDRKTRTVVENKNAEIKNVQDKLKAEQEKNMSAEELTQKKIEEARQQEAEKVQELQNENLKYYTQSQLANAGLPVSDELVNSYIAMGNKETIATAITTQKNVLEQQLEEKAKRSAESNRPKQTMSPNTQQNVEQVTWGNANNIL